MKEGPDDAPQVLLLRAPDEEGNDRYVQALGKRGLGATCRPVLRFAFAGDDGFSGGDVASHLRHPGRYAGLIVTSPRAGRALAEALRWLPGQVAAWEAKPAFAVGARTAEALRAAGLAPRGEESGDARALASVIAKERTQAKEPTANPLLFLCGNRRRDTLPQRLSGEGLPFEECIAYETHLREGPWLQGEPPDWAVFFSPSGVRAVQQAREAGWASVRKAAIGPTTAAALEKNGWPPEVVAPAPAPEALAEALAAGALRDY